jgi:hypothetical protein
VQDNCVGWLLGPDAVPEHVKEVSYVKVYGVQEVPGVVADMRFIAAVALLAMCQAAFAQASIKPQRPHLHLQEPPCH